MGSLLSKKADPLKVLHEILVENIFSYASSDDLQACLFVSKSWHKFIGNSELCMEKLELKFHDYCELSKCGAMMLINSKRKYNAVSIRNAKLSPEIKLLLAHHKWRSVKVSNLQFSNEMEFLDFLGFFEPTVNKISFENIKIFTETPEYKLNYIFPNLRHLEIVLSSRFISKEIFCRCCEIKHFILDIDCAKIFLQDKESKKISDSVKQFLINNSKLRVLHLGLPTDIFNEVFTESLIKSINFKLQILKLHRFKKTQDFCNSLAIKSLEIFMKTNSETLQKIHIDQWLGFNALCIIYNEMKNVTNVVIKELHECSAMESHKRHKLNPNPSIKVLNMFTFARYHKIFDTILNSSPNITTLAMFALDQKVLNLLSINHQQLEYLHLDCIIANEPLKNDAFPMLKFICAPLFISKKFLETIQSTPSWRQTNFDQKLINFLGEYNLFWSH
jgi:hypothetical protein